MNRLLLIISIIFTISFISCSTKTTNKPNFIIIFTDDQGYADVGCYGAKGFSTPNLDNMANDGIRFTNFYSAAPSCSPSRAALLTGSYPVRVGVPNVLFPISPTGLDSSEITIAEILKDVGYNTACVGKWHLGDHPSMMPRNQGFDEYFGLPYSNDMWPWRNDFRKERKKSDLHPDLPLYLNENVIEYNPDQNQLTKRYTEYAVKFISKNKANPFFLYIAHTMPHIPLGVTEKFEGKTEYGRYGDVIEEIDWSVGQIIKTLEENNLDENTMIIFTSDNGPWLTYGDHAGKAYPLREGKGTTFEGGMRIPCIMKWTNTISPGFVNKELSTTMDLLPTITFLAGSKEPHDRVIDGKNIWPIINEKRQTDYEAFFYHRGVALEAVRSGKWKLHFPHQYRHIAGTPGTDGKSGGQIDATIGLSLYNLDDDVSESINLVSKYPDIVERLTKLGDIHIEELKDNSRSSVEISDLNWRKYQDKLSEGEYLKNWWLIGPFDNTDRKGMSKEYQPEKEIKLEKNYIGRNDQSIVWQEFKGDSEYISLAKIIKPSDVGVVYAYNVINLKNNSDVKIGIGSNDGIKMWLNGKLVHENIISRTAVPNEDTFSTSFIKGENHVLLKIDQLGGGWGFYFSIIEGQDQIVN